MRAAAHVEPVVARPVDRQLLVFGEFLRPFGLEAFAVRFPFVDELLAAPHLAAQRLVGADDRAHLFLDRGQIVHAKRLAAGRRHHVIIEPVVGRRTEGDLSARPQRLHRLGQHMRVIVAYEFERVILVARGDQRQLGIAIERAAKVAHLAIHARGQRGLG